MSVSVELVRVTRAPSTPIVATTSMAATGIQRRLLARV